MKPLLQKNARFFDSISRYYDGLLQGWLSALQKPLIGMVRSGSRVLDAGCGTGNLLLLLHRQKKNLELHGIDISKGMLAVARKKLKGIAVLRLEAAEHMRFKHCYFDYVLSTEAFHHYADYERVMQNFFRVLKKGGRLIVLDFDFGRILNWLFSRMEPGNSRMHTAAQMNALFKRQGFSALRQQRAGSFAVITAGRK
jgi:ubiquinone/menaquinone biosynthesis C-methylase UbiE